MNCVHFLCNGTQIKITDMPLYMTMISEILTSYLIEPVVHAISKHQKKVVIVLILYWLTHGL